MDARRRAHLLPRLLLRPEVLEATPRSSEHRRQRKHWRPGRERGGIVSDDNVHGRSRLRDLSGQRFGKWIVVSRAISPLKCSNAFWTVRCDCGTVRNVVGSALVRGRSKSCGCLKGFKPITEGSTGIRHGLYRSPAHSTWVAMLSRCRNPNHHAYKNYGGRGIAVCERWLVFANFVADMGEPPEGMSIDRIDVNGNYEPRNCTWSDIETQNNNQRGMKRYLVDGQWRGLAQLHRYWKVSRRTVDKMVKAYPSKIIGEENE